MTFQELVWMAEGKQELMWDLSNSIMCQIYNTSKSICSQIVASAGGKPKPFKPLDFSKINPYRK